MVKKDENYIAITKRLDAIIRLILESQQRNKIKVGQQVLTLVSLGFTHAEIAGILGVKRTSIPSMLPKRNNKTKSGEQIER